MKGERKIEEDQFQFTTSNVQQQSNTSSASSSSAPVTSSASVPAPQPMVVNKRKAEDYPEGEESRISEVFEVIEEEEVKQWVCEIEQRVEHEDVKDEIHVEEEELCMQHENELDQQEVSNARKEEIGYMQSRSIWSVKPISDCWEKTGKAPVTVRWVDVQKAEGVRSRLVARDFKGGDKDRDDLYAATPPLESKRLLISRAATKREGKLIRKLLFIDVKKAHLNPRCQQDVYIELPAEAEGGPGMCGKLNFWLYGFRPAASAWEDHYSEKLEHAGFVKRKRMCCIVLSRRKGSVVSCSWR